MPDDPREAVLERLCAPPGTATRQSTATSGVATAVVGGMPPSADRSTIVFRKERSCTQKRVYAVSYDDTEGQRHFDIVGVDQQPDGSWSAGGGAGGSGKGPIRDRPWVNFGGWWGVDLFCAGGEVIGTGADQARRVRLSFADGTTVEDTVDDGVVLFLVEHGVQFPATASILDASGTVLATHESPGVV